MTPITAASFIIGGFIMRRFIGRSVALTALVAPALVAVGAGSAQAAQCPGPSTHPDRYSSGTMDWKNGAPEPQEYRVGRNPGNDRLLS